MATDPLPSPPPDAALILAQAAAAFRGKTSDRPSTGAVVDALLQAEKAAKQQRVTYPLAPLLGEWQLCFATGTRKVRQRGGIVLGKGFYLPSFAPAQIAFEPLPSATDELTNRGEISNQVQLGPIRLRFTGPFHYLGKKNLLAFDFTQIQVSIADRSIYRGYVRGGKQQAEQFYEQSIAKLPFFAFFWVTEAAIAARGRGGGLALWVKRL